MSDLRNVAAVVLALTIMQIAIGALGVVVPLELSAAGAAPAAVGAVAAAYTSGFLLGAVYSPQLISLVGHIRAFAAFAALGAVATLSLHLQHDPVVWGALRAATGACVAGLFAAGESWIAGAVPRERRGGVLSAYLFIGKAGLMAGPFTVAGLAPGDPSALMIAGAAFALCLVPVAATRREQPSPPSGERAGVRRLIDAAPAAAIAAFCAGLANGAVLNLVAVYARDLAPTAAASTAATLNAAFVFGGLVSQWPAGVISDRFDRRLVIAAMAGLAALTAAVLAATPASAPLWLLAGAAFFYGAGALSFYGVAVAHAADRASEGEMAKTMAGMLIAWGLGAVLGPLIGGAAMESPLGARSLFVYAAAVMTVLTVAMVIRRRTMTAPAEAEKSDFAPAQATSVAQADLDPRVAEDTPAADPAPPPAATEEIDDQPELPLSRG